MKEIVELILSAENIRMMVLLAAGFAGFVWQNAKTEKKFSAMEAKFEAKFSAMDAKIDAKFYELRYNDLAHLTTAFKSLTFVLKENRTITEEQQQFIDAALQPLRDSGG
jgi:hypothetical protein